MKNLTLVARLFMGLVFFVFGSNGLFHFLPMPPMHGVAATFFTGLAATGYLLPLLFGTMTISGALLLSGFFVPLAIVAMAPIIVNIFLFHVFVERSGIFLALVLGALEVFLAFYSEAYSPVVKPIFRSTLKLKLPKKREGAAKRKRVPERVR